MSKSEELGAILKKHRTYSGKSIRQISRETKLHHGFIARMEQGERGMSVDSLARISASLGIGFLFEYMSRIVNEVVERNYQDQLRHRPEKPSSKPKVQAQPRPAKRDAGSDGSFIEYVVLSNGVPTKFKIPVSRNSTIHLPNIEQRP